jgi:hypothetical protein
MEDRVEDVLELLPVEDIELLPDDLGEREGTDTEQEPAALRRHRGPAIKRTFMDIPVAAELAGFSVRHFRRIIEDEEIPIVQIGRKFFILGRDFENWENSKKKKFRSISPLSETRFRAALLRNAVNQVFGVDPCSRIDPCAGIRDLNYALAVFIFVLINNSTVAMPVEEISVMLRYDLSVIQRLHGQVVSELNFDPTLLAKIKAVEALAFHQNGNGHGNENGRRKKEAVEIPPPLERSRRDVVREVLLHSNSVNETAAKLTLNFQQLVAECRLLGLREDLLNLLK